MSNGFVGPRQFSQRTKIEISGAFQIKYAEVVTKALQQATKARAQIVANRVSEIHRAAKDVIRDKLIGGITPLTGGTKAIKYSMGGRARRLVTPRPWPELTPAYAARNPKSKAFWVKHPGMTSYKSGTGTRKTLAAAFARDSLIGEGAVYRNLRTKSITKKYLTLTWDIFIPTPHSVASELISAPFVEGISGREYEPGWWYDGPISKADSSFVVYVEGQRPFIRRMSWKIGRDLRKDIARVLRSQQKKA